MKRRPARPVVITSAERSQEDQLRIRTIRYVVMMSIRVVFLILAVVVVSLQPPLLWLWLLVCAVGMAFLPWIAVLVANYQLPKERHRWRRPGHRPAPTLPAPSLADHSRPVLEQTPEERSANP